MIFHGTGEVQDGFHVLGSASVPVYLLDGPEPVLFDGGLTCLGDAYVEGVRKVLGTRSPKCLYLTHVHFDHCGAVSRLRRAFPGMRVAGSDHAREILQRPNAIRLIRDLNHSASDAVHGLDPNLLVNDPFEPFEIDDLLEPGGIHSLGDGRTLRVLSAPGHTWDFLSFYVPEQDILVASEAAGILHPNGYVMCECLVDFVAYLTSLRRLASLNARLVSQAHHYVFTDRDVEVFFRKSTRSALEFHSLVERLWEETQGDVAETVERVKALEWDPMPMPRQPEPAYRINLEARIRSILHRNKNGRKMGMK
jgi:glyoxylase-like metal-dependent hydrolase (beta-lactamase superfamily II)